MDRLIEIAPLIERMDVRAVGENYFILEITPLEEKRQINDLKLPADSVYLIQRTAKELAEFHKNLECSILKEFHQKGGQFTGLNAFPFEALNSISSTEKIRLMNIYLNNIVKFPIKFIARPPFAEFFGIWFRDKYFVDSSSFKGDSEKLQHVSRGPYHTLTMPRMRAIPQNSLNTVKSDLNLGVSGMVDQQKDFNSRKSSTEFQDYEQFVEHLARKLGVEDLANSRDTVKETDENIIDALKTVNNKPAVKGYSILPIKKPKVEPIVIPSRQDSKNWSAYSGSRYSNVSILYSKSRLKKNSPMAVHSAPTSAKELSSGDDSKIYSSKYGREATVITLKSATLRRDESQKQQMTAFVPSAHPLIVRVLIPYTTPLYEEISRNIVFDELVTQLEGSINTDRIQNGRAKHAYSITNLAYRNQRNELVEIANEDDWEKCKIQVDDVHKISIFVSTKCEDFSDSLHATKPKMIYSTSSTS
jgi:hypothetical protein